MAERLSASPEEMWPIKLSEHKLSTNTNIAKQNQNEVERKGNGGHSTSKYCENTFILLRTG